MQQAHNNATPPQDVFVLCLFVCLFLRFFFLVVCFLPSALLYTPGCAGCGRQALCVRVRQHSGAGQDTIFGRILGGGRPAADRGRYRGRYPTSQVHARANGRCTDGLMGCGFRARSSLDSDLPWTKTDTALSCWPGSLSHCERFVCATANLADRRISTPWRCSDLLDTAAGRYLWSIRCCMWPRVATKYG